MPKVNPELLRWARETAGLTVEEACGKLGIRDTRAAKAHERLMALESGTETPSRSMLVKLARQYRRPLVAFYVAKPPRRGDRGQDFRGLCPARPAALDPTLDALIRDIQARQAGLEARRVP